MRYPARVEPCLLVEGGLESGYSASQVYESSRNSILLAKSIFTLDLLTVFSSN
jgi:hypothetical protein